MSLKNIVITLSIVLLIAINVIIWLVLPAKIPENVDRELKELKDKIEQTEKIKDSLLLNIENENKKTDSLENELIKSKNALWKTKQSLNKLRDRPATDTLLDSLLRARQR